MKREILVVFLFGCFLGCGEGGEQKKNEMIDDTKNNDNNGYVGACQSDDDCRGGDFLFTDGLGSDLPVCIIVSTENSTYSYCSECSNDEDCNDGEYCSDGEYCYLR
jgi:hypothetical protein